jgi:PST family polysaccharide transporter
MPIISTLKILSVLALLQSVMTFTGSIFYSQGATRLNFKISVVYGIFNILIFYIGSLFSIEMVALLLLCGFILYVYPRLYFVSKLIDIGVIDILINLKHIFFVNSICMLISFIFFNLTFDDSRNLFSLVSGILIYLFLYIISNYMFNKKNSLEFVNNIRNVVKS